MATENLDFNVWVDANLSIIAQGMERERQLLEGRYPGANYLDLSKRWLSEMPLCGFLKHTDLQTPSNWRIVSGSVLAWQDAALGSQAVEHRFLVRRAGAGIVIVDFLVGQFLAPFNDGLGPGSRIRLFSQLLPVPQMVTTIDEQRGIAYVRAPVSYLENAGLSYKY